MINDFIEVTLNKPFLVVCETLTRIGISGKKETAEKPKLYQSCHLLHKRNKFYIVHFKSMFALDGKQSTLSEEDIGRTNRIAKLLEQWGLITIINSEKTNKPIADIDSIRIISHKDKDNWQLVPKYNIGKKLNH